MSSAARSLIWLAVAAAVGLSCLAVVAELWAGAADPATPPTPAAPGELHLPAELLAPDADTGYGFRPNASRLLHSAYGEFAVLYEINEYGLREPGMIFPGPRPPHVLFVGDEYTEGWGVMREATFIQEAQRQLRVREGMDRYTRLLNAGVTGYGAAQSARRAARLVELLGADVIVFVMSGLMPVADYHFLRAAHTPAGGLARLLPARESVAAAPWADLAALRMARSWYTAWAARAAVVPGDPASDRFAAARDAGGAADGLIDATLSEIAELRALAARHDIRFVLLHVPLPHQVAADEWPRGRAAWGMGTRVYPGHDEARVRAFCAERGLVCLFAGDALRALARRTASPVYFRVEHTLTKAGHRALVEPLLDTLVPILLEVPLRRYSSAVEVRQQMRARRQ